MIHQLTVLLSCMSLCSGSVKPEYKPLEEAQHYLLTEDPSERRNIDWVQMYYRKKRMKNCLTVRLNTNFTILGSKLKLIKDSPVEMKITSEKNTTSHNRKLVFSLSRGGKGSLSYRVKRLKDTLFPSGVRGAFKPRDGGVDYVVRSCSQVRPCSILCRREKKTGQGRQLYWNVEASVNLTIVDKEITRRRKGNQERGSVPSVPCRENIRYIIGSQQYMFTVDGARSPKEIPQCTKTEVSSCRVVKLNTESLRNRNCIKLLLGSNIYMEVTCTKKADTKSLSDYRWREDESTWDYFTFLLYHKVTGEGTGSARYRRDRQQLYGLFSLGYSEDKPRLDIIVEPCGTQCIVLYTLKRNEIAGKDGLFLPSTQQNIEDIVQCQAPGVLSGSCQLVHLNTRYLMSASNNPRQASTFLKLVPASRLKLKVKSVSREGGHQTGQLIVFSTEGGGEGYLVVSLIDQVIFGNINTADTVYRVDNCGWKYFGCILMYEIDLRHRY